MPRLPPLQPQSFGDEVIALGQRIKEAQQKRAEADAAETAARARLAKLTGGYVSSKTNGVHSPVLPSPVATRSMVTSSGQGERILSALRDHPRLELGRLAEQIYGDDSKGNRQSLASMLFYLCKTSRARKVGRGQYEAIQ